MGNHLNWINFQIMAETLLACHMIACYMEHRDGYLLRVAVSSAICLLLSYLYPMPGFVDQVVIQWGTLLYIMLFLFSVFALKACYRESFSGLLCIGITGYTIHHLSSTVNDSLNDLCLLFGNEPSSWVLLLASLIPVYVVCFFLLTPSIRKTGHVHVTNRMVLLLSAAALLVDVECGLAAILLFGRNQVPAYDLLIKIMDCLACIFVLYIQFSLMSNQRLQTDLLVVSRMLEEEKRQYEQSRTSVELINQKCHDLKHQIRSLETSERIDRNTLRKIEETVDIYDTTVQTGCAALDIILSEKKLLCESRGIMLTCMADGSGLASMPAADIYSLFGNILDNAIEAVSLLQDPDSRSISMSVRRQGRLTVIHEENRYDGRIILQDGLPETGKAARDYHGYGLRSVRLIAESNNGSLSISTEDHIFSLTVMISPEII